MKISLLVIFDERVEGKNRGKLPNNNDVDLSDQTEQSCLTIV